MGGEKRKNLFRGRNICIEEESINLTVLTCWEGRGKSFLLSLFYFGCEEGKGEGRRERFDEREEGGGCRWYLRLGEGGNCGKGGEREK